MKSTFSKVAVFFLVLGIVFGQAIAPINPSGTLGVSIGRARTVDQKSGMQRHNVVQLVARHPKVGCADTAKCGEIFYQTTTYNLVTNAGLNWLADIMSATSAPSVNTQCNYIALTNVAITPAAGDTTLNTEIVANGLQRAQATYTHSANATTYTLAKTFTATGAQAAQAGAVFTASSGGTMCFEDTFTPASLQTNDTLSVTWTVTI